MGFNQRLSKDQVKFIMEATGIYHLGLLNELQKTRVFCSCSESFASSKNILTQRFEKGKQIEKMP